MTTAVERFILASDPESHPSSVACHQNFPHHHGMQAILGHSVPANPKSKHNVILNFRLSDPKFSMAEALSLRLEHSGHSCVEGRLWGMTRLVASANHRRRKALARRARRAGK